MRTSEASFTPDSASQCNARQRTAPRGAARRRIRKAVADVPCRLLRVALFARRVAINCYALCKSAPHIAVYTVRPQRPSIDAILRRAAPLYTGSGMHDAAKTTPQKINQNSVDTVVGCRNMLVIPVTRPGVNAPSLLHFACGVAEAKCILVTAVCVSVARRIPTLYTAPTRM